METIGDVLGGILAFTGTMLLVAFVGLIVSIVMIICNWKLFVKMGEPGWKSIIPIYNSYVLFQHAWGEGWMFLTTLIPVVGLFFSIVANWKLFKKFGKSALFCVVSIFFSPICSIICALDSSTFTE